MVKWAKDNIPWIVTSIATFVMGIAANQVTVTAMKARLERAEARIDAHDKFTERLCRMEAIQGIGECKR